MKLSNALFLTILFAALGCATTTWRGTDIRDRLANTPGLGAHEISIDEQSKGVITLRGIVSSNEDRDTIETVARNTRGVSEVKNNLVVAASTVQVREGSTASATASSAAASGEARAKVSEIMGTISASPEVRDYNLNVEVIGETAILSGEVGNNRERTAVENIARNTLGITNVRNELTVLGYGTRYQHR